MAQISIGGMATLVISFIVFVLVIGIGGTVLGNVAETQCENGGYWYNTTSNQCERASDNGTVMTTIAYNATGGGLDGVGTFGDWLPTIAVILASALVIGIIAAYFYMRG